MARLYKQVRQDLFSLFLHSSVPLLASAGKILRASIVSEFKTRSYKPLGPDHISTNRKTPAWIIKSYSRDLPLRLRWQEMARLNGDLVDPFKQKDAELINFLRNQGLLKGPVIAQHPAKLQQERCADIGAENDLQKPQVNEATITTSLCNQLMNATQDLVRESTEVPVTLTVTGPVPFDIHFNTVELSSAQAITRFIIHANCLKERAQVAGSMPLIHFLPHYLKILDIYYECCKKCAMMVFSLP